MFVGYWMVEDMVCFTFIWENLLLLAVVMDYFLLFLLFIFVTVLKIYFSSSFSTILTPLLISCFSEQSLNTLSYPICETELFLFFGVMDLLKGSTSLSCFYSLALMDFYFCFCSCYGLNSDFLAKKPIRLLRFYEEFEDMAK
jgi:hypothetical protein